MRIRAAAVLAAAALLSGCGVSTTRGNPPLGQQRVSWAMYQHSPDRDAVFRQYVLSHDWTYDTKAKINGGLALVGNTLLFTTFSHALIALDVRDGHELWRARVPNIAMSTPIVAGNTVYIGTGRNGILDRGLKRHFTVKNVALKIQFGREPIWGVPAGDEIAAFDLRTGATRWIHHTIGEDMPSAVYVGGRLIFANGEYRAYALRADTGAQLWSTDLGGIATMANAVLADKTVIVSVCADEVNRFASIALDPATGKILWRSPYGHCDASPAYADGKVFVSSAIAPRADSLRGKIIVAALDAKTGKPVWIYRGSSMGVWSAVSSEEVAIAGTYASGTYYQPAPLTDEIVAFYARTGKVRWRFHTAGPVKMSPIIDDGRLYAGDTAGVLYALDAHTGALIELRPFKNAFTTSPPIIAGNKLIVVNGTSVDALPISGTHSDPRYYDDTVARASK